VRLLLDEMIGPRVAVELVARGIDAVALVADCDLRALPDPEVLRHAAEQGRTLVTRNIADFARLHQHWPLTGPAHAGIVLVSESAFPQNRKLVGALVAALAQLPAVAAGEVHFLKRSRG
jgi:predicted nuclease of predicted toxin-antitoxin system